MISCTLRTKNSRLIAIIFSSLFIGVFNLEPFATQSLKAATRKASSTLQILPSLDNSVKLLKPNDIKVVFLKATRVLPPLSRTLTYFNVHMLATEDGSKYSLRNGRIQPYEFNLPSRDVGLHAKRASFKRRFPHFVTKITEFGSGRSNGEYLGIWRRGRGSLIAYYRSENEVIMAIKPILVSVHPIESVDHFPDLHGAGGVISVLKNNNDGSSDLILLSMKYGI